MILVRQQTHARLGHWEEEEELHYIDEGGVRMGMRMRVRARRGCGIVLTSTGGSPAGTSWEGLAGRYERSRLGVGSRHGGGGVCGEAGTVYCFLESSNFFASILTS